VSGGLKRPFCVFVSARVERSERACMLGKIDTLKYCRKPVCVCVCVCVSYLGCGGCVDLALLVAVPVVDVTVRYSVRSNNVEAVNSLSCSRIRGKQGGGKEKGSRVT
jgi:hypothetical protein